MAAVTTNLPVAPANRGRTILVATGFAIAACIMFFAGLFGVYFRERAAVRAEGLPWIDGVIEPPELKRSRGPTM